MDQSLSSAGDVLGPSFSRMIKSLHEYPLARFLSAYVRKRGVRVQVRNEKDILLFRLFGYVVLYSLSFLGHLSRSPEEYLESQKSEGLHKRKNREKKKKMSQQNKASSRHEAMS